MDFSDYENIEIFNKTQSFIINNEIFRQYGIADRINGKSIRYQK